MKFCPKCNNALIPDQKNTTDKKLMFTCLSCNNPVEGDPEDYKISGNYTKTNNYLVGKLIHICDDITVPVIKMNCRNDNCKKKYVKYIKESKTLKVTYICSNCKTYWSN